MSDREISESEIAEEAIRRRLAANVRHWRLRRGATQRSLASDLEIDLATLRRLERAVSWPTATLLGKLVVVLEVDVQDLFADRPMATRRQGRPARK